MVAVRTRVLLECPLREAVEGEGGDGAFEMWGGDAPRAVGATPAGEVIPFDPDQTFIHTSTFVRAFWDSCSDAAGRNTSTDRARKVTPARQRIFCMELQSGKSN